MKRLLGVTIRHNVFVNILTALALFAGAFGVVSMAREVFPEMSIDMILVSVAYRGADPEEVEEGICRKLEEAIEGLEGVKNFYTYADEGGGAAVVECLEEYGLSELKEEIREAVDRIMDFPPDAERPSVSELTLRQRVLNLSLFGDATEADLKETAERIKAELALLPEISQVSVSGVRDYEISIEVSEEKLRQFGITLDRVSAAVRSSSLDMPGGSVKTEREEIFLRSIGRRYTADEFGRLVLIASPDGTLIPLERLAALRDGFTEDALLGTFNGQRSALVSVFKTKEEDTLAISRAVDRYIAAKILPWGMKMEKWMDTAVPVQDRISLLTRNGIYGFCLVFLILWLFLDLRLGFWVSLGIPISLGGGLAVMALTGQTLNMLSMFALIMVLGIVVDDAIVIGESIYRRRRKGIEALPAALEGANEVSLPVIAAVFTSIVAFIPLLFVKGIMGKFIAVVPLAVIAALSTSLLECMFLLPAHLNHLPELSIGRGLARWSVIGWPARIRQKFSLGLERFAEKVYAPLVGFLMQWRYVFFAGTLTVMLIALGLVQGGLLKFTFFPDTDTEFCSARIEFPRGTPMEVTLEAAKKMEKGLWEAEEKMWKGKGLIRFVSAIVGSQSGYEHPLGAHLAEIQVQVLPASERDFEMTAFIEVWRECVGDLPGAVSSEIMVWSPGHMGKPIEVWILGREMGRMRDASAELRKHLSGIKGVYNVQEDYRPGKREIRIQLKPEARALGLTFADVASQVRAAFWGSEALRVQRGRDNIRVYVRYPLESRSTFSEVRAMRIATPAGDKVPLLSIADFTLEEGYARITRKNGMRRLVVTADVNEELGNAREIKGKLRQGTLMQLEERFPGISVSASEGQEKEMETSMKSLAVGFGVAAFGIFLILATIFRSYVQPLVIITTVPFGFAGVVFSHLLMGYNLTMMSLFGLVALSGVVVNDAIIMIEAINSRLSRGMSFAEAVKGGGIRRFRPVILTTLTTFFGLLPLMTEQSFQAKMLIPMAISIAFGVAFATLLTLFLLPCELGILNDFRRLKFYLFEGRFPSAEEVEPARRRGEREESKV